MKRARTSPQFFLLNRASRAAVATIPAKRISTIPASAHNGDKTHHHDHDTMCASLRPVNTAASSTATHGMLTLLDVPPGIPRAPS